MGIPISLFVLNTQGTCELIILTVQTIQHQLNIVSHSYSIHSTKFINYTAHMTGNIA